MELVKIDKDNWEQVIALTSNPDGVPTLEEQFIASNAYSLLQAQFEPGWHTRGIAQDGRLIGFAMYGWNSRERFWEISRIMLDRKEQGRGFGKMALKLVLREMAHADQPVYISAEPENIRAYALYHSIGFQETGSVLEGEKLYRLDPEDFSSILIK